MSRLATIRRFRSDSVEHLAEDCARLVSELDEELAKTQAAAEQPYEFGSLVTGASTLRFGATPRVDTRSASVALFFQRATSKDASRSLSFVKTASANSITVSAPDGSLLNGSASATHTAVGFYEWIWDGREWWLRA